MHHDVRLGAIDGVDDGGAIAQIETRDDGTRHAWQIGGHRHVA